MDATSTPPPDNILSFQAALDQGIKDGTQAAQGVTKAAKELEQARKVFAKAVEIVSRQILHDAAQMEAKAIVDEIPLQRRHQHFHLAAALREAEAWMQTLCAPNKDAK